MADMMKRAKIKCMCIKHKPEYYEKQINKNFVRTHEQNTVISSQSKRRRVECKPQHITNFKRTGKTKVIKKVWPLVKVWVKCETNAFQ